MGYHVGLISGAYATYEFGWQLYLQAKNNGIHIRPNDEIVTSTMTEEEGYNTWIEYNKTVTGENFKAYYIVSEDGVDKYKVYFGEYCRGRSREYQDWTLSTYKLTNSMGVGGAIKGSAGPVYKYRNQIFKNIQQGVEHDGANAIYHYPAIIITDMNNTDIAYIPLAWSNSGGSELEKTEGSLDRNYTRAVKKVYNTIVKIIVNDGIKIVEISAASRTQTKAGNIVIGYIKGVGIAWECNDTSDNIHIGNQLTNSGSTQARPDFVPHSNQVYMVHQLPYKYDGQSIEYLTHKTFVTGAYSSAFTIFEVLTTSNYIYDCSNIQAVAEIGSRIKIDNTIYYVIENSIIPIEVIST